MKLKISLLKLKYWNRRPPVYGKKTLKVAFEFGVVLSEVARERKIKLTPAIVAKAEEIMIAELQANGLNKTAVNFIPLIIAVLEGGGKQNWRNWKKK